MAKKQRDFEAELEEGIESLRAFNRGENNLVTYTVDGNITPIHEIRHRLGLSQQAFAALLGVSIHTLQDWEQGRRHPSGAAKTLLRIVDSDPEVLLRSRRKVKS